VAPDPALDVDDDVVRPFLERQPPREAEERTLVRARNQPKVISGGNGGDL